MEDSINWWRRIEPLYEDILAVVKKPCKIKDGRRVKIWSTEHLVEPEGETFSGVDYEAGLNAVEELRTLVPEGATMAQFAVRWILMFPEVSSTIAGAKNQQQITDNVQAASLPPLSNEMMQRVREVYDKYLRAQIHDRW